MEHQLSVKWECSHCFKMAEVSVMLESPSDYISDTVCEFCGEIIKDDELDNKIMLEVSDYFIGRADYYND